MDHGYTSEKILYDACKLIFGEDLVFLSPEVISETGKKEELTDVLVILDKYLITIQSKSLDLSSKEIDDIKFGRITKKYEEAKRQINRTINAFNRKMLVPLNTVYGKEIILPWENIEKIIPIITINLIDNEYSDPEYRFQFPIKVEKYKNLDMHTFMLHDFFTMISELNTGGDFINYIKERQFLSSLVIQNYTNELDILAIFISQYGIIEDLHNGKYDTLMIQTGTWEEYRIRNRDKIQKRDKKKFAINVIDITIKELRSLIDYTIENSGIDIKTITSKYFHLLGILSLLTCVEAIQITEKFVEKLESSKREFIRYFMYPKRECGILFLIINEPNREKRKNGLLATVGKAAQHIKDTMPDYDMKEIIGIATEGKQLPGRSLDIVNMPMEDALSLIDPSDKTVLFKNTPKKRIDEWTM